MRKYLSLFSLFFFASFSLLWAQKKDEVWMTYNVQNMFDGAFSGTEYQTFSQQQWNEYYAQTKMLQISQVLGDIHKQYGTLGLILLQEVENIAILEKLRMNTPSLQRMKIVFAKRQDQAAGLALMTHHNVKKVDQLDSSLFNAQSRPILMATLEVGGQEVLVITVHLPSRLREKNMEHRVKALELIANQVQKSVYEGTTVFLAGDFNADLLQLPSESLKFLDEPNYSLEKMHYLVSGYSLIRKGFDAGSYVYKGHWEKIDYLFFSYQFFNVQDLHVREVIIFCPDYLMIDTDAGPVPKAFRKDEASPGYSDHLPLLALVSY